MSVRLDWEIGAEHTAQNAGDDPETRRQRQMGRLRLLLLIGLVIGGIGGVGAVVITRLNTVDSVLRGSLIQAAQTEITALQIGDGTAFRGLMESQDPVWVAEQSQRFDRYQALKAAGTIQFPGAIPDSAAEVDGQRGRVIVNETVNGQSTEALWFFWRYATGWRQVPMDVTFWGTPGTITRAHVTITYDGLDATFASALADRLDQWWTTGPQYLSLTGLPALNVQITHKMGDLPPTWDDQQPYTLIINSPLITGDRAPIDPPIDPQFEQAIAGQVSAKLIDAADNHLIVNPNADAAWLQSSLGDWMTALLLGRANLQQVGFMQTLAQHYGGSTAIVAVVTNLTPAANIGAVAAAVGQPLNALNVDWKEFFQWRLGLEKTLIQSGDQTAFNALWDESTPAGRSAAANRWTGKTSPLAQVQNVTVGNDPTFGAVATVQGTLNGTAVTLRYRLVGNNWLRLS